MKKLAVGVSMVAVLVGCRALVGIGDLDVDRSDGGPPNGTSGGGPGTSGGNGTSGGPGSQRDSGLTAMCAAAGADCPKCCKDNDTAFRDTFTKGGMGVQCLCDDKNHCTSLCSSQGQLCGPGPTQPPGAGDTCVPCTDGLLRAPADPCRAACREDPACLEGLECMKACK